MFARRVSSGRPPRVDTPDTTAERQQAEDAYHRPAIDQEQARLKRLHDAAWRCGDAETPEPPTRREVIAGMARQLVDRVCELATKAYREVEHFIAPLPEPPRLLTRDREQERTHERGKEREREPDRDIDFGPSR